MKRFKQFMETLTDNPGPCIFFGFLALLIVILIWGCSAPERRPVPPPKAHLVYLMNMTPKSQVVSVYSLKPTDELGDLVVSKRLGVSVVKHGPMYDINKDFAIDKNADKNSTRWMRRREARSGATHIMKMMIKPGLYKVFIRPEDEPDNFTITIMRLTMAQTMSGEPVIWMYEPDEDKGAKLRLDPVFLLPIAVST